jgi:hypothetical protein
VVEDKTLVETLKIFLANFFREEVVAKVEVEVVEEAFTNNFISTLEVVETVVLMILVDLVVVAVAAVAAVAAVVANKINKNNKKLLKKLCLKIQMFMN